METAENISLMYEEAKEILPKDVTAWPHNLEDAIAGRGEDYEGEPLEALQYLGDTGTWACAMLVARLTERERKVLDYRYKKRLSLHETAAKYGVTGERIRQVEAKAIRKLRKPVCVGILQKGLYAWAMDIARDMADEMAEEKARQRFMDWKQEFLAEWEQDVKQFSPQDVAEERWAGVLATTVEEMDLSVRSYNCLKRAGLNTAGAIQQAAARNRDWWAEVRNLGRKSYEEICDKMRAMGIEIVGPVVDGEQA